MQIPPQAVLATWPTPNYIDPPTRGKANFIVNLTLFPLAFIFLILRIYTRLKISKSFGLDDVFILAAIIPTTGFFVLALLVDLDFNIFRHTWDIPSSQLSLQLQTNIAAECLFGLAFMLTKLSILQLLRRVLQRSSSRTGVLILIFMGIVVMVGLALIFTVIFQCSPVSAYWTLSIDPQNCISEKVNLLVADILNTFTDLLVVLLPIFLMWNLNLPLRKLLIVSSLFALGVIVVIAGIFRTFMFWHLGGVFDKTWVAYYVWLASEVELYTGVLCASILPIQPLFMKLFPTYTHLFLSSDPSNNSLQNSTYNASAISPSRHPSLSKSSLSIHQQKQEDPRITRPLSRITVQDEIIVSFELQRYSTNDNLDLESGLVVGKPSSTHSPKGQQRSRSGSKDTLERPSRIASLLLTTRTEDDIRSETPSPGPQRTVSQFIRYLRAPQAKLVRIDSENPRIRTITPDSAWGTTTSNGTYSSRGSRGSWASSILTSMTPAAAKRIDNPGKKHRRVDTMDSSASEKGDDDNRSHHRASSTAASNLSSSYGSESIGMAITLENFPLPLNPKLPKSPSAKLDTFPHWQQAGLSRSRNINSTNPAGLGAKAPHVAELMDEQHRLIIRDASAHHLPSSLAPWDRGVNFSRNQRGRRRRASWALGRVAANWQTGRPRSDSPTLSHLRHGHH